MTEGVSPCAVCGAPRPAPRLSIAGARDIVRCQRCGHMQVAELPAEAVVREVGEAVHLDEEADHRATARRALGRIERHVRPGMLCDLGLRVDCMLSEAERRGWEGVGVEPSRFAAARLPEGRFDAVVMDHVIQRDPDPGATLERVAGLLCRGGVVYLALPDAGSAVARVLGVRWWSVLPTNLHYFTRSSMARLLGQRGFAIQWVGTAPKAFSTAYFLGGRVVAPDLRDRMAVVARRR